MVCTWIRHKGHIIWAKEKNDWRSVDKKKNKTENKCDNYSKYKYDTVSDPMKYSHYIKMII